MVTVGESHVPRSFHVMAKPTGAKCNLDCAYCFFLKKESLYPGSNFRMSDAVMERYISQTIGAQRVPRVTIAWQGGEPTLMGLDFFRKTIAVQKKYTPPGMLIENTLQTNGVLINDEWCRFLRDHHFLVGLSMDGPRRMHDAFRRDCAGNSVFDRVLKAARLLQAHEVEFNVLCTVNAVNSWYPLPLYRFFRDELRAPYLQFIPIVERDNEEGNQEGGGLTSRTVEPVQYGRFLVQIFDEWVSHDVGRMFVLFFDGVLSSYLYGHSSLCILRPSCGDGVALEHNGDLYSCDHFVEPRYRLGNISATNIKDLVSSEQQRQFGLAKSSSLPSSCRNCRFLFTCYGECPKNRLVRIPGERHGLNWLCPGLKYFYEHTEAKMRAMANLLTRY